MDDQPRARRAATRRPLVAPDDLATHNAATPDDLNSTSQPTADTTTAPSAANTSGELLRRARDLLLERNRPLTSAQLAQHIFSSAPTIPGLASPWERLLDQLLTPSALFTRDPTGAWSLSAWDLANRPLDHLEFAIVDVETTGLSPVRHRLIEVAAVIVQGSQLGPSFTKLINPGRPIPQFITKFTGIGERTIARSAPASAILPKLHAFIADRPIVGHNIGFDLSFLNSESDRNNLTITFPDTGIDTITLARHHLTGLRRFSLDRVAAALHIPAPDRHRALADATITAHIFTLLLARARQDGCQTLADLYRSLDNLAPARSVSLPATRPTGRIYLNPAWRQSFPTTPGVYLMKDSDGVVIYVGKAKCLRDRLASYYSQPLGYTRKMDGLLQNVHDIETRQLGSELEALLVESALIKQLQPRYNVQLRNYEHYPFIKVDIQHPYPRVYATREISPDGARYFGPFRSGRIVDATIELIQRIFPIRTCLRALPPHAAPSEPCLRYHLKRCPAPCRAPLPADTQTAYRAAIEEACAFLGGERADLIDKLKAQMFTAAARQDYERAARLRDALRNADQVLLGQRLVTGAVEANNLLIIYPSAAAADHLELFLIRHGRLIGQRRIPRDPTTLATTLPTLIAEATNHSAPPARVGRAEVDHINIIARWIHRHSDDHERAFFRLPTDLHDPAAIATFITHVTTNALADPPAIPLTTDLLDDDDTPLADADDIAATDDTPITTASPIAYAITATDVTADVTTDVTTDVTADVTLPTKHAPASFSAQRRRARPLLPPPISQAPQ